MDDRKKDISLIGVFGENVKKARWAQNLTIKKLAEMADYDRGLLSKLECGRHDIEYKTALKLARALDVSFPELFSRNFIYSQPIDDISGGFKEDNYMLVFRENFKRELKSQNKTLTEVCDCTGYDPVVVSRIFNGHSCNPTLVLLATFASVTNSEIGTLFLRK